MVVILDLQIDYVPCSVFFGQHLGDFSWKQSMYPHCLDGSGWKISCTMTGCLLSSCISPGFGGPSLDISSTVSQTSYWRWWGLLSSLLHQCLKFKMCVTCLISVIPATDSPSFSVGLVINHPSSVYPLVFKHGLLEKPLMNWGVFLCYSPLPQNKPLGAPGLQVTWHALLFIWHLGRPRMWAVFSRDGIFWNQRCPEHTRIATAK